MSVATIRLNTMNLELTTNCPLRCPQCYCSLTGGKNLDLETAIYWIKQGGALGVKDVMLSGGETLCYPHIYEVIAAAKEYCGRANIALSGYGLNQNTFERLVDSGVSEIFISLNGSSEEINSLSRDGFSLAMDALKLLKDNKYPNTVINWVMHSSNADDFPNIVSLAESFSVHGITVMAVKPDSAHQLSTLPSGEQMLFVSRFIKEYRGSVKIGVESCFSPMLALISETKLFGNLNVGKNKGCGAGINTFSINVEGKISPCRHLEYYEEFETLKDYIENSDIQKKIRMLENTKRHPCSQCRFADHCRHCLAINAKIHNDLYIGNEFCSIYSEEKES